MGIEVYDEVIEVLRPIERIVTEDELCFQVGLLVRNSYQGEESTIVAKAIVRKEAEKYKVGYRFNHEIVM